MFSSPVMLRSRLLSRDMPDDLADQISLPDWPELAAVHAGRMCTQDKYLAVSRRDALDTLHHDPIIGMVKNHHVSRLDALKMQQEGNFDDNDKIPFLIIG